MLMACPSPRRPLLRTAFACFRALMMSNVATSFNAPYHFILCCYYPWLLFLCGSSHTFLRATVVVGNGRLLAIRSGKSTWALCGPYPRAIDGDNFLLFLLGVNRKQRQRQGDSLANSEANGGGAGDGRFFLLLVQLRRVNCCRCFRRLLQVDDLSDAAID